jgi:hypothetical protein
MSEEGNNQLPATTSKTSTEIAENSHGGHASMAKSPSPSVEQIVYNPLHPPSGPLQVDQKLLLAATQTPLPDQHQDQEQAAALLSQLLQQQHLTKDQSEGAPGNGLQNPAQLLQQLQEQQQKYLEGLSQASAAAATSMPTTGSDLSSKPPRPSANMLATSNTSAALPSTSSSAPPPPGPTPADLQQQLQQLLYASSNTSFGNDTAQRPQLDQNSQLDPQQQLLLQQLLLAQQQQQQQQEQQLNAAAAAAAAQQFQQLQQFQQQQQQQQGGFNPGAMAGGMGPNRAMVPGPDGMNMAALMAASGMGPGPQMPPGAFEAAAAAGGGGGGPMGFGDQGFNPGFGEWMGGGGGGTVAGMSYYEIEQAILRAGGGPKPNNHLYKVRFGKAGLITSCCICVPSAHPQ